MREVLNADQFRFYGDVIIAQEKPLENRVYAPREIDIQSNLVKYLMDEKLVSFGDEERATITNEYVQKLRELYIKAGEPGLETVFPFAVG